MAAGELILLVNDIPDHVDVYVRALQASGFRVHAVRCAADALEFATSGAPDLGVIDVRLPDMGGWDLCRAIKNDPAAGSLPIVILAPDVSETCADESARSGCNAWLAHPTRAEDIVRAVRQVLETDLDEPRSPAEAVLGVSSCPACATDRIKATLRVQFIQYYSCKDCGLCWRVDTPAPVSVDS
jgi:CheY-like chemotaxis protein